MWQLHVSFFYVLKRARHHDKTNSKADTHQLRVRMRDFLKLNGALEARKGEK